MRKPVGALALVSIAASVLAADTADGGQPMPAAWAFAVTAYPTQVRGGDNYTSGIATAERGPLHLEGRVNYESIGARSAFVGWSFAGGEALTWKLTPLLGGAWGTTQAVVPGLEAAVAWRALDFYIEAEYVRDKTERSDSYTYAWSELGLRPVDWLRLGLAGQRTRIYGGERDLQRGPFVQLSFQRLTLGVYCFNPGASDQVLVGSLNLAF